MRTMKKAALLRNIGCVNALPDRILHQNRLQSFLTYVITKGCKPTLQQQNRTPMGVGCNKV